MIMTIYINDFWHDKRRKSVNNIKEIFAIANKLKYLLNSRQKRRGGVVLVCIVVGAIFEMIGISIIVPFLYAMLQPEKLWDNVILATVLKLFSINTNTGMLIFLGLVIALLYIVKNIFLLSASYIRLKFCADLQGELSVRMLNIYMKRPYSYFRKINSAEVMRATTGDPASIYMVLLNLLEMVAHIFMTLMMAIYLLYTDWGMAVGVLILAGFTVLIILLAFKNKIKRLGVEQRQLNVETTKAGYEAVEGIKEITVMHRREKFVEKYRRLTILRQKKILDYSFVVASPERVIEAICVCGLIGIVCIKIVIGADLVEFIPKLGAFALAAFKIMPAASKLSGEVNTIIYYIPALNDTYDHLKIAEKEDYDREKLHVENINDNAVFLQSVELENVLWKYDDGQENVLDHINLSIKRGEAIALIGPSGAGKTTLADIILGLFTPVEGTVKMDGIDIRSIPEQWATIIGYVPQSVYLLDDTIRGNIAFGLDESEIQDSKVWWALEQAQLKEYVDALPAKLDTIVGERGVKLSGGQRQRLAIARALYYNPEILVLDEATSALDDETEKALMESIDALKGNKTLIIIAHRLTTIRNCDKVYEVKNGRVYIKEKKDINVS